MTETFETQRGILQQKFRDRASQQAAALNDLSVRFEQNSLGSSSKEQIRWIAHSLAGAAGTFGFPKVSESAAELERSLASPVYSDLALGCRAVITQIRQAAAASPATSMRRRGDVPVPRRITISEQPEADLLAELPNLPDRSDDGIMVVALPESFKTLSAVVTSLGYFAVDASTATEQAPAFRGKIAAAIICDDVNGALKIARNYSLQIPVLLIAADVTFHHRLAATRMGVNGILPEPLDVVELADWLRELAPRRKERPFSILIIDGDQLLADTYALELQIAGMDTEVVTDGTTALDRIAATSPDLVLLDIHLPGISGIELAKIIRQSRRDLSLPIVFVSAESDPHLQFEARIHGGDDFIGKPVDRRRLVALVELRAKRGMELRSLMERDGLTGLLNHGQFMTRLSHEIERCRRTGGEIALAMIDIDHLRQTNEAYGHVNGDRIIRGLAHALTARLRRIDVIGRYSGDAFAVILLDTSPDVIAPVFEQIREAFSQLPLGVAGSRLSASISVGIAGSRAHSSSQDLVAGAGAALLAAKRNGRNRVERLLV